MHCATYSVRLYSFTYFTMNTWRTPWCCLLNSDNKLVQRLFHACPSFSRQAGRAAVNGLKVLVPHNGASVIRAPKALACIAAQKACFSISKSVIRYLALMKWTIFTNPSCVFVGAARWAPAVTQPAPHFKGTAVLNGEFKEISLGDYKGKYLVLFFYPLDL